MEQTAELAEWVEGAVGAIITSANLSSLTGQSPRLLSHALPSPSIPGHLFPDIINKVRSSSPASEVTWVNLLHAVPGQFKLSDLPSSPPATPGMPLGAGEDYFTTKLFPSAVTSVDYDGGETETIPLRYQPLAPPASVHLAIVERYIPPTSPKEFANLFSLSTPSLLVDRMIELVPGNGCLVFIYPTKTGAKTFMNDHLGPILDPLLRSIAIVNNFSADLSNSIGHMISVDRMMEFEIMRRKIDILCNEINKDMPSTKQRLHGLPGGFSLVYSHKGEIKLDRKTWSDWWVKQEKPRIRTAVRDYFRVPGRLPSNAEFMPTSLIQEILDGVSTRRCENMLNTPTEVGIFVIKRG